MAPSAVRHVSCRGLTIPPAPTLPPCVCHNALLCHLLFQVGDASKVELSPTARMRLGAARLLLLDRPHLVLIDDANRFQETVPRFPGRCVGAGQVAGRLRATGICVRV